MFPAEWKVHKSTWLAWPDLPNEWREDQAGAREEFLNFARTILTEGARPQEKLHIFVKSEEEKAYLANKISAEFHLYEYGDIWLRDTGCVFGKADGQKNGKNVAHVFRFNGWGEKYLLGRDAQLSSHMQKLSNTEGVMHDFVFEGGAFDHNGEGVWLTTKDCLLNPNRNPGMTQIDYDAAFAKLGARSTLWIERGLMNDHTDGHVDNVVRFVDEKTVVCMTAVGESEPQKEVLDEIEDQVKVFAGRNNLECVTIPSVGEILNHDGDFMPASYMNFYIANNAVAVPLYGTAQDQKAVEIYKGLFKDRKVVGLSSNHILTGGGSFHCISQQEPV